MVLSAWQKYLKSNAGKGKSIKTLARNYKAPSAKRKKKGSGLSAGKLTGGKASKGALAALLQGLNANINVK